ncbi:MAG: GNAT family N-acetyltransferase [Burkholderiaceae bacterium]
MHSGRSARRGLHLCGVRDGSVGGRDVMRTGDATLRPATVSDALCISVLGMQVFLDNYATDGIRPSLAREVLAQFSLEATGALLTAPHIGCIVAERDRHLIGFALWSLDTPHALVATGRPAKLERLYVQEPFVGSGLGSSLLTATERGAAAKGADVLWLTTWVGNRRALDFYPRRGYADFGATTYALEHEKHENRVFARSLVDAGRACGAANIADSISVARPGPESRP